MIKSYREDKIDKCWERRYSDFPLDPDRMNTDMYPLKDAYNAIKKRKGGKILEVGCGLGRILKHLRAEGMDVYGMEHIFVPMERLHKETGFAKLFQTDVKRLPIKDGSFDILTAFGVFHCIEEGIDGALRECNRVLKPGGVLCASVLHRDDFVLQFFVKSIIFFRHPRSVVRSIFGKGKISKGQCFHKWLFKKCEWEEMLRKANFKIYSTRPAYKKKLFYGCHFSAERQRRT